MCTSELLVDLGDLWEQSLCSFRVCSLSLQCVCVCSNSRRSVVLLESV